MTLCLFYTAASLCRAVRTGPVLRKHCSQWCSWSTQWEYLALTDHIHYQSKG